MHRLLPLAALAATAAMPAQAAVFIVFDDFDGGAASFDAAVTGAGGTGQSQVLAPGENGVYADFAITRPGGAPVIVGDFYELDNASPDRTTSGGVIRIDPTGPDTDPRSDPLLYRASGLTFSFTGGVNGLGFEVGDWSTCCHPSNLWMQFGSNAPILVGASTEPFDQFLTNGGAGVFVGAFDNSATFTEVSFWGDGVEEILNAGGTIRYATIPEVPEPATWAMLLLGFGAIGSLVRARRQQSATISFA